jgi:uroporphyrinogen decarboxylase
MPLVLRRYQDAEERLNALGLGVRIVAARGPLTVASWLTGIGGLMEGIIAQPALVNHILDAITTTLIDWLQAQLDSVRNPEGILLLDDLVGMVSRRHYQALVGPCLQRIFERFAGMVRLYHNDTPCPHLLESLAETGFDVFNFSHEMDIAQVKARMGKGVALMGNVAPLGLGVRGEPEQVYQAALECLEKGAPGGGMILSFGGGVSPETKAENIDALARAAAEWPVRQ